MKKKSLNIILLIALGLVNGCTTGDALSAGDRALPAGVSYEDPPYEIVDAGYRWQYHDGYGWGWRHPQRGWRYPSER